MDIGYVWDDEKYQEVQRKHKIQFHEVVSVFDDQNRFYIPDPGENIDRLMCVGRTFSGRILSVIFSDVEDAPLIRLITVYETKGEHLNEYYKRS